MLIEFLMNKPPLRIRLLRLFFVKVQPGSLYQDNHVLLYENIRAVVDGCFDIAGKYLSARQLC